MTTRANHLLAVATFAPADMRAEFLREVLEENGQEALVDLFADFIGIARSVIENTQESVEGAVGKDLASRINYPSLLGAMYGLEIAIEPVQGMCGGCAFRKGTCANQSVTTVMDAKDGDADFFCHERLESNGKPTRYCAGWLAANAEQPPPETKPTAAVQQPATAEGK